MQQKRNINFVGCGSREIRKSRRKNKNTKKERTNLLLPKTALIVLLLHARWSGEKKSPTEGSTKRQESQLKPPPQKTSIMKPSMQHQSVFHYFFASLCIHFQRKGRKMQTAHSGLAYILYSTINKYILFFLWLHGNDVAQMCSNSACCWLYAYKYI